MHMHVVNTKVGTTIWFDASMMACLRSTSPPLFSAISRCVLMFSIITGVVHQDADGERQAAQRHDIDVLSYDGQRTD
jgi:hypothetical protein